MGLRYLLDTHVCVYAVSGRYPLVTRQLDRHRAGKAGISVVVLGELMFGISMSQRREDALLRLDALQHVAAVMDCRLMRPRTVARCVRSWNVPARRSATMICGSPHMRALPA